jgi:hypothetical protein
MIEPDRKFRISFIKVLPPLNKYVVTILLCSDKIFYMQTNTLNQLATINIDQLRLIVESI